MATASITDFRGEFPEFSAVEDAVITALIKRAQYYHDITTRGIIYAAAHLHCLDKEKTADLAPDGGAGVVTGESIGSRSVQYATNAGSDERKAFWARSPYGREFLQIESRNVRQGLGIVVA